MSYQARPRSGIASGAHRLARGAEEALERRLADPDLYARDRGRFETTSSALAAARERVDGGRGKWLALEMQREEIDGPE